TVSVRSPELTSVYKRSYSDFLSSLLTTNFALVGFSCTTSSCGSADASSRFSLFVISQILLLSKATSQATLNCLKRCLNVIKRRDAGCVEQLSHFEWRLGSQMVSRFSSKVNSDSVGSGDPQMHRMPENINSSGLSRSRCSSTGGGDESSVSSRGSGQLMGVGAFPSPILNMDSQVVSLPELPADAQPDTPFEETELGSVEEQKHVVLHLLSQLKLGMDLTKIVLPTFILEKRSLLEMFADYMAHPDLYIQITRAPDPESRMIAFVQWYLTTFHAGRKDKICKKPYNPIIGESFHCCWPVDLHVSVNDAMPTTDKTTVSSNSSSPDPDMEVTLGESNLLIYCAEQVSHHPPVTAFYFDCPAYKMELNASLHAKSKFQGMSVSVTMLGKTVLRLGEHNEEYHFAFPTAYARSILTVPWVELADKVAITCPQTGYSASVTFHTKVRVFFRQVLHGFCFLNMNFCLISLWVYHSNSCSSFKQSGRKWTINVNELGIVPKYVRPIESQRPEESRRLWQHVTAALQAGNIREATERKRELEERQRASEKFRVRHRIPFPVKFFEWNGAVWNFRNPPPPASTIQPMESIT
ncbi:Oxysterol-binding protein, partial [Fasciolopsis buskii]